MNENQAVAAAEGTSHEIEETPIETTAHPVTEADPEGDGLDAGQTTADVHGDVLGL